MNVITGRGGLPMVQIQTPWSAAEIYLHGASVTHFQLHGESPLLFLSEQSRFEPGAPIRGGLQWRIPLSAAGKAKIEYQYRITFPAKTEIVGGNRRD